MPIRPIDDIRTLIRWAPLLGYARQYSEATDAGVRNAVIGDALEWLASQTTGKLDDELAGHVAAVLRTAEGAALVRWFVSVAAEMESVDD